MGFLQDYIQMNLRGGGACCAKLIKKERRLMAQNKDNIIFALKENANKLVLLSQKFEEAPQFQEEAIEVMSTLFSQNKNLQQLYIRTNMCYLITMENGNDIYNIQLDCLTSLQAFIKHQTIKAHEMIQFCLDLFYIIYQFQIRLKNSFLNHQHRNQYATAIENLQKAAKAQNLFIYEISIIEIAYKNCRKDESPHQLTRKDLFNSRKTFDVHILFQENQQLLNYNFDSNENEKEKEINHFELHCFYQIIKWAVILQVQIPNQPTLQIPIKILEYTFSQHLSHEYPLLLTKYWIQIIFDLIAQAQYQPIQGNKNSMLVHNKFQELSKFLIESYLKFYTELKVKDKNRENLIIDPYYEAIKFLSKQSQSLKYVINKINLLIQKFKNQSNQQLLTSLKKQYFKFVYITNEIYQSIALEVQKLKLVNTNQSQDFEKKCFEEYIKEIHQSNQRIFEQIIEIEKQIKNPNGHIKTCEKIKFPQIIYSLIDILRTQKENQYFQFSKKQRQKRLASGGNPPQGKEVINIQVPIKSSISMVISRFSNGFLNQKEISQINNDTSLTLRSDQLISLEDLQKLQINCFKWDLILKNRSKQKLNKKKILDEYRKGMDRLDLPKTQYWKILKDNLNFQEQEIKMNIEDVNVNIQSLIILKEKVNRYIYDVIQEPKQEQLKFILNQAFQDLTKSIKDLNLDGLNRNIEMNNANRIPDINEQITFDELNKLELNYFTLPKIKNKKLDNDDLNFINKKLSYLSEIESIMNKSFIRNSQVILKTEIACEYMPKQFVISQILEKDSSSRLFKKNTLPDWKKSIKELTSNTLVSVLKELLEDVQSLQAEVRQLDEETKNHMIDLNDLINNFKNTQELMTFLDRKEDEALKLYQEIQQFVSMMEYQQKQQRKKNNKIVEKRIEPASGYQECIQLYKVEQLSRKMHIDTCQCQINPIYVEQRFKIKKYNEQEKISQELIYVNSLKKFEFECYHEVNEFLQNAQGWCEVLLLFGSQGSGKSRELRIIQNKLWEQYQSQRWIPIFISLSSDPYSENNKLFVGKLKQIFRNDQYYNDFVKAVNSQQIKVLFLLDDIDEVKIDIVKQNLIKLNFQHLDINIKLIGKTVKFVASARSELKDLQNYQLYFSYNHNHINLITEIQLLPFNDDQRQQYFQLNHQISIKKILFNHFIQQHQNDEGFENIWIDLEQEIQKFIKQQERELKYLMNPNDNYLDLQQAIIRSKMIENIQHDFFQKIVQDISKLRSTMNYMEIIKNHQFENLTQTPLQLEIFVLQLSTLRTAFKDRYFKEQLIKSYSRLKQKYSNSSTQLQSYRYTQSLNIPSLMQIKMDPEFEGIDENLSKALQILEQQKFFKQYQYFNILKGDNRGIQMDKDVFAIKNDSILLIDALRANNLTMYQIIATFVDELNIKYAKQLEDEIESYEFHQVLQEIDTKCENLAFQMTINNLIATKLSLIQEDDEIEEQQSECEQLHYNPYLVIKQGNICSFKYKIIQEYYFARFLKRLLIDERQINIICNSDLNQINLTGSNFTGALNVLKDDLRKTEKIKEKLIKIIKMSQDSKYMRVSSNCMYLISFLNFNLGGEDLQKIELSDTDISGISFFNCNLSGSVFRNVIINRCNFDFAKLNNVKWYKIQIAETANLFQNEKVEQVVFTPDGNYMISLSVLVLKKWDCRTYELINQVQNPDKEDHFQSVAISNIHFGKQTQYVATCSQKEIILRDFKTLENILYQKPIDFTPVNALQFSPDAEILGIVDPDGWLRCWRADGQSLQTKYIGIEHLIRHSPQPIFQINNLAFNENNSYFLFKGNKNLRLFELQSSRESLVQSIEADLFNASLSGKTFAIANMEDVIFYNWQGQNLIETQRINFRFQILQFITFNSKLEIGIQFQEDLVLWNTQDNCINRIFKGYQKTQCYNINPEMNVIAQWNDIKENIKMYNMNDINPNKYYQIFDNEVLKAEFSYNGQLIILQLQSKIIFWDCPNDECINILNEQTQFCFSPKGNLMVTKQSCHGIILWDCSNIYDLQRLQIIRDIYSFQNIFFSSKQELLALITDDRELMKTWKVPSIIHANNNFNQQIVIDSEFGDIVCIAISTEVHQIAYVGIREPRSINLYDQEKGVILKKLNHSQQILSIEYSYNGQLLASRSQDDSIKVWYIKQSGQIAIPLRIKYNPNLLDNQHICTWIPNRQLIIASNEGDQIILWEMFYSNYDTLLEKKVQFTQEIGNQNIEFKIYSKTQLVANECKNQECLQVSFSPNGKYIAASYFPLNNISFEEAERNTIINITPRVVIWKLDDQTVVQSFVLTFWQTFNFSPDSSSIVSLEYDQVNETNQLKFDPIIRNADTVPIYIQMGFNHPFNHVVFSPKLPIFLAVREEKGFINHFVLFSINGQQLSLFDYFQIPYGLAIAFSTDGEFLAYSGRDTILVKQIYNVDFRTEVRSLKAEYNWSQVISYKFDNTFFAFCNDKKQFILSTNQQTVQYENKILNFQIFSVSFDLNNNTMACGGVGGEQEQGFEKRQGVVKIIDIHNLEDPYVVQNIFFSYNIIHVFFSENGTHLLIQEQDYQMYLLNKQEKNDQYQIVFMLDYAVGILNASFSSNYNDFIILIKGGNVFYYNFIDSSLRLQNDSDNNSKTLYRLKTIPKYYVMQAMKCEMENAQIFTEKSSLSQLFKYYGAN
ncbi:unnamed protein product (macronuclear) [Paramecium tetraurelia]|uniref:NACHT domain-containing protein n=1 Tax=Paramecium tetraurelia TaxID=5888 RepID=A0BJF2_PARTE|nr:uncharacterized protein GSPATT00029296001 [Paramecium tetraurelia]CAK58669.1 unnamed protein product [Paramecium tetraurelia]|eukprot:XP_001426067.1 hypothetical protein (macronuclear) [Paramecium tetraurelia strain d4-2]